MFSEVQLSGCIAMTTLDYSQSKGEQAQMQLKPWGKLRFQSEFCSPRVSGSCKRLSQKEIPGRFDGLVKKKRVGSGAGITSETVGGHLQ